MSRLGRSESWVLLGTLGVLIALNVPELGSDPWPFRPPSVDPTGVLAPLVLAAGRMWDPDVLRSAAILAGLAVALAAVLAASSPEGLRRWVGIVLVAGVLVLLTLPGVLLQVGLRDATAPWFHTNDSTYQMEIAGDLILGGTDPYGHDYRFSGLERFYSGDGSVTAETRERQVALRHLAYFPGTPLTAAAWRLLPAPWSDYRLFVLLATLAALPAALLFGGPLGWRLALGAAIAGNPLAVRAVWFGTADAPSILATLLAFGLLWRSRYVAGAAALGAAVVLKQFALFAIPFFLLALLWRARERLLPAAAAFCAVVAAGALPLLIAGPGALWSDTIAYGAETYRIIGYGLAALLLKAGFIDGRFGAYPFAPIALVVWLPATLWLLRWQWRSRALWTAGAGFAVSMFLLLFVARVFQQSYLIWPLLGIVLAGLLAVSERRASGA